MLVRFHEVSKAYGSFDIFHGVSFQIDPGQKVGLLGPNGTGKTTLLGMIAGTVDPDTGTLTLGSGTRVGCIDQIPDFGDGATPLSVVLESFADLQATEQRLRDMEASIAEKAAPTVLERYSELLQDFEFRGGYSYRARAEAALLGVGFGADRFTEPARELSGGEKNRLALVRLLLAEVDLLLLDEPTNHLDIRSIEWLEHFLKGTDKALLIVSHDRFFLDQIVSRVLCLEQDTVAAYKGNYSAYTKQRAERRELQQKQWQRQQEWIRRTEDYIRRNIYGQKTKQAQSRRNMLKRTERIRRPEDDGAGVRFNFAPADRTGRYLISARGLSIGYEPTRPILDGLDLDVQRGERWALVGANGSGKTTLLRSLIGGQPPLGGELVWDERLAVGYYAQQLEDLDRTATVLEELRAVDTVATDGELRSFLGAFLFRGEEVFKQIGVLSGGEKSRLTLAKIIYKAPTLLALDEPTNHLDIRSREALETALKDYPGTMILVTHDRYLVRRIATHILCLGPEGAQTFDRFDAFEQWLGNSVDAETEGTGGVAVHPEPKEKPARKLSKNKREQLAREAKRLEDEIADHERDLREIEALFASPPSELEWDDTNRRYTELKESLERLYRDLEACWNQIG